MGYIYEGKYVVYKDMDQIAYDTRNSPTINVRHYCSTHPECVAYNHMGWAKTSVKTASRKKGMYLYVKEEHRLEGVKEFEGSPEPFKVTSETKIKHSNAPIKKKENASHFKVTSETKIKHSNAPIKKKRKRFAL